MTVSAPLPRERAKRIVYVGTPQIAVPPLRALVAAGFDVALVITGADKRRGRGNTVSPCPVKEAAVEMGLVVSHDINDVLSLDADGLLGVVVAFGSIISDQVLQHVPMINIHYSALPRWRGAAPVERAILAGDTTTAVCIIRVADQLDAGEILASAVCPIDDNDTVNSLRNRLGELSLPLLIDVCTHGVSSEQPQEGEVVVARKIVAHDLKIDWQSDAKYILRQVRLGNAFTFLDGKRLKIHEARVNSQTHPPASIVHNDECVLVGAGTGSVELLSVQPEGKPRLSARDWANGLRLNQQHVFGEG